jgi:hypothetical protein
MKGLLTFVQNSERINQTAGSIDMQELASDPNYQCPVFVVGMPRSGTTLIQGILCNTGVYFPVPETHYFSRVAFGLNDHPNESEKEQICHLLKKKARINIDIEQLRRLTTQKEIFEFIIGTFNSNQKNTFLEKTPRHVFFISKIHKYYPSAKFICMIREPKNVVSSQISTTRIDNKSIIRLAFLYNKISSAIIEQKDKKNVMIIKYEDLTTHPDKILQKISNFLDIPYNPEIVAKVAAPPEIVSSHEFWKNNNVDWEIIRQNEEDKWKTALSNGEANIINWITKSHAEIYGYDSFVKWMDAIVAAIQDLRKLLAPRELKRLFSKTHG